MRLSRHIDKSSFRAAKAPGAHWCATCQSRFFYENEQRRNVSPFLRCFLGTALNPFFATFVHIVHAKQAGKDDLLRLLSF